MELWADIQEHPGDIWELLGDIFDLLGDKKRPKNVLGDPLGDIMELWAAI